MTTVDLGDGVTLHLDDEWRTSQEQPKYSNMETRPGIPGGVRAVTSAIVHHSGGAELGDPDPRQWLRNIWHFHVDGRRYSDIAYESAVDEHGDVWALRDNSFVGAHTLQPGDTSNRWNKFGTAVVLLRTTAGLDPQVKLGLRKWYGLQCVATGWRALEPTTHHDVDPGTECPGTTDVLPWVHSPSGLVSPTGNSGAVPPDAPPPPAKVFAYPGYKLQRGSIGKAVYLWQVRLNGLGIAHLALDSQFGPATDAATRRFQEGKHLAVDGIVGPITWDAAF